LDEDNAMAKASTGPAPPVKGKPPPSPTPAGKKAKLAATASAKKSGTTAALKKTPSKMAAAPKKATAKAPQPTKAAVKIKAAAAKKTAAASSPYTKAPAKKAPAGKAASPRGAPLKAETRAKTAVKTVAVKQAAPRRAAARIAVPTPVARRGRPITPSRKTRSPALVRKPGTAPQSFTVSHLNETDFKTDGLRAYAQYRDLGIAAATGGLCQAHVIRMVPPCTAEVRKRHVHQVDLQLVYVLKGWMKNEFEGQGEQMMSAGSCWLQPSGIEHTVLDYSPDCEVLEIIVPADFKTEETV
jgi:uncharacterized RmlC-like cupin family protein